MVLIKKFQREVNEILSTAYNSGMNLIENARDYGDSEEKISKYLVNNNFIIATKLEKKTSVTALYGLYISIEKYLICYRNSLG